MENMVLLLISGGLPINNKMDGELKHASVFGNSDLSYDLVIIGGGVFGLSLGCTILKNNPDKQVCILEKGLLPTGASSKNAGQGTFVCYTEFIDDVRKKGCDFAVRLVKDCLRGLQMLMTMIDNDPEIIRKTGGYDVITEKDLELVKYIDIINQELYPILNDTIFELRNEKIEYYGFDPAVVKALIYRKYDWQIHTGKLLKRLIKKFQELNGHYITGVEVTSYVETDPPPMQDQDTKIDALKPRRRVRVFVKPLSKQVAISSVEGDHAVFCVNSYGSTLFEKSRVSPAREQVMITKPIKDLKIDCNFLLELSYYYFRQIGDRLLFGGGRHLDPETEETLEMVNTEFFKKHLVQKVRELFPKLEFEVDYFWTGIIAYDIQGHPYRIEKLANEVYNMFGCNGTGMALCFLTADKVNKIVFGVQPKL